MTPSPTASGRSLEGMDNQREVQEFLTALRARLTPEQAGLTIFGGERRVPGLRREEVAQLAGVSTAYYTRMEHGNLSGVSESVLYALARALHLDEAETTHLLDLARTATGPRRPSRTRPPPTGARAPGPDARHDAGCARDLLDPARRPGRLEPGLLRVSLTRVSIIRQPNRLHLSL